VTKKVIRQAAKGKTILKALVKKKWKKPAKDLVDKNGHFIPAEDKKILGKQASQLIKAKPKPAKKKGKKTRAKKKKGKKKPKKQKAKKKKGKKEPKKQKAKKKEPTPVKKKIPSLKVRVTTGIIPYAASVQHPTVTIQGTASSFSFKLKHLPPKGHSFTTVVHPTMDIGTPKTVKLAASGPDAWFFTKFSVNKINFGCVGRWLDGKPFDRTYDGEKFSDRIVLHETSKACKAYIVVKATTGKRPHSGTASDPQITIEGTHGTASGRIKPARKGMEATSRIKLTKPIGNFKSVIIRATSTDGWYFTKISVDGKELGCAGRWLDGKPYDKTPATDGNKPISDKITLTFHTDKDKNACETPEPKKKSKGKETYVEDVDVEAEVDEHVDLAGRTFCSK